MEEADRHRAKETPGIISSATADIDGDGKAEIAIAYEFGMNSPTKGKLALATQATGAERSMECQVRARDRQYPPASLGRSNSAGTVETLIIAPLFGPEAAPPDYQQAPATILRVSMNRSTPVHELRFEEVATRLVLHAIEVIDVNNDGLADILTADNGGALSLLQKPGQRADVKPKWESVPLIAGVSGLPPKRGCSEVHLGRADNRRFLATIEPWHGTEVVVNMEREPASLRVWPAKCDRRYSGRGACPLGR